MVKWQKLVGAVVVSAVALAVSISPVSLVRHAPVARVAQALEIAAVPGTYVSAIVIQNPNTSAVNVSVQFYKADGTVGLSSPLAYTLTAGESRLIYVPNIGGLANGQYSAVIESDQPVVAMTNLTSETPSLSASYEAVNENEAGTSIFVPSALKNYYGFTTNLVVQNVATSAANVTVTFKDLGNNVVGTATAGIPAKSSFSFDQAAVPSALPNGFIGSATITSSQPVVAVFNSYSLTGGLSSASGTRAGATKVYLPFVANNYYGWITAILVQNVDTATASVRVTTSSGHVATADIPPGANKLFYQGNLPTGLPAGWQGSAVVESTNGKNVAVIVNTSDGLGQLSSYNGFTSAQSTKFINLPGIYNNYYGWNTAFLVQNIDASASAPITIQYLSGGAVVKTVTDTLAPGQAKLHYQPNAGLPSGFNGSVKITSSGGNIVAMVNEANPTNFAQSGGDWLLTYTGFNTSQ